MAKKVELISGRSLSGYTEIFRDPDINCYRSTHACDYYNWFAGVTCNIRVPKYFRDIRFQLGQCSVQTKPFPDIHSVFYKHVREFVGYKLLKCLPF